MTDLAEFITSSTFTPVRLREGYDMAEVDQFLDELIAAVGQQADLRPMIDNARFSPVRLREGYDMAEVDEFLQLVATGRLTGPYLQQAPGDGRVSSTPAGAAPSAIEERRGVLGRLFGRG